jgi:hypothetical protein
VDGCRGSGWGWGDRFQDGGPTTCFVFGKGAVSGAGDWAVSRAAGGLVTGLAVGAVLFVRYPVDVTSPSKAAQETRWFPELSNESDSGGKLRDLTGEDWGGNVSGVATRSFPVAPASLTGLGSAEI